MTSPLVPTGEETWSGGRILYMPSAEDCLIHFTPRARAGEIVSAGKLDEAEVRGAGRSHLGT
jgi:hypothetical protein